MKSDASTNDFNYYCTHLKAVFLVDSGFASFAGVSTAYIVTSIPQGAFYYFYNLVTVIIPSSVTSIGNCAFMASSRVSHIILPSTLQNIGFLAFAGTSIVTMILPSGTAVTASLSSSVTFNVRSLNVGGTALTCSTCSVSGITSTIIGGSFSYMASMEYVNVYSSSTIRSLGWGMFYMDSSLKVVVLSSVITSIQDYAFYGCSSLQSISLPSSISTIGAYSFSGCTALKSMTIPSSTSTIGANAFRGDTSLSLFSIPLTLMNPSSYTDANFFLNAPLNCVIYAGTGASTFAGKPICNVRTTFH